ncbi:hypothetical protein [Bacillus thuringiensis]|uniref:Uncharacterized protein n=1 Tax=Bacillus thuringiensis TaxID=1428 RepID=A0A9X6ZQY2_BACTU|nr:hypothetical protein [Bacillus thuringiensis]PFJ32306.1 hypothetical protein COJ15_28975 [Bacillus thuringiensis]
MNIQFETREKQVDGLKEYHVYDVTDGKEVYAGCVKNFTWNKGVKGAERNKLEPFDANDSRISTDCSTLEKTQVELLIERVQKTYADIVKEEKRISDEWEVQKENALRLGVSEEQFKRYYNTRSGIQLVLNQEEHLEELNRALNELVSFSESEVFLNISSEVVTSTIKDAIYNHQKDIRDTTNLMERTKGYLKK